MADLKEVEAKVEVLADLIEGQLDLVANPRISLLRAAFQGLCKAFRAQKLHAEIFADLGLDQPVAVHSTAPFETLVEEMENRGSHAADDIKALLPDLECMISAVEQAGTGGNPFGVIRAIRAALSK